MEEVRRVLERRTQDILFGELRFSILDRDMQDTDRIYAYYSADLEVTVKELPERDSKWDLSHQVEQRHGQDIDHYWDVAVPERMQRHSKDATVGQVIEMIRRHPEDEKRIVFLWDGEKPVPDDMVFVRTVQRDQVAHFRVRDHAYRFEFPGREICSFELDSESTVRAFKQTLFYVHDSKRSRLTRERTSEPADADLIEVQWKEANLRDDYKFYDIVTESVSRRENMFRLVLLDPQINIAMPIFPSAIPFKWDETVMAFSLRVAKKEQCDFQLAIEDPTDPGKLMLTIGNTKKPLEAVSSSRALCQFTIAGQSYYRRFLVGTSIREVKAVLARDEAVRKHINPQSRLTVKKSGEEMASDQVLNRENREFELKIMTSKKYHFVYGGGQTTENFLPLAAKSDQSCIRGKVGEEVGKHVLRMNGVILSELVHTTTERRILVDPIVKMYQFELSGSLTNRLLDPIMPFQSLTRSFDICDPDKIFFVASSNSLCPAESSIAIVDPAKPIKVIEPARIGEKSFKRSATIGEVRKELRDVLHPRILFQVGDRVLLNSARLPEVGEIRYSAFSQLAFRDKEIQAFKFTFHHPHLQWESRTFHFFAADKADVAIKVLQDHLKGESVVLRFRGDVLTPDDYLCDIGYTSQDVIKVTFGSGQTVAENPKPGFKATADELALTVTQMMERHKSADGSDMFCAGRVLPPALTLQQCGVIAGDMLRWRQPSPPKFTESQEGAFWETMTYRTFEVAFPQTTELIKYNDDTLSIGQTKVIVAQRSRRPVDTISLMFKPGNSVYPTIVPQDAELIKNYVTWNVFQPRGSFVAVFVNSTKTLEPAAEESIRQVAGVAPDPAARGLWLECDENKDVFEQTWAARHPRPK
jgi:hypothetical protein